MRSSRGEIVRPAVSLGLAALARLVEERAHLTVLAQTLIGRATRNPVDAGALLDLSMLMQLTGERERGLVVQAQALGRQRCYRTVHGTGDGPILLVLAVPGDLMANTPVDFLLEGSNVVVVTCYIEPDELMPAFAELPEHDVAMLAVGPSPATLSLLARLAAVTAAWPRPMINSDTKRIAGLSRDGVCRMFADDPDILSPATRVMSRAVLDSGAQAGERRYPLTIRPVGSQAGHGLEMLEGSGDVGAYLARHADLEFYLADYVDYSGTDGQFRKLRIVFMDCVPFISHLAISADWIVHYLSAGMAASAWKRAEEAAFMASFDADFAVRHARAFASLCDAIQLDYFGIDCSETRDGRLLLFEVDIAMIVHTLDAPEAFDYKQRPMAMLRSCFVDWLTRLGKPPGARPPQAIPRLMSRRPPARH